MDTKQPLEVLKETKDAIVFQSPPREALEKVLLDRIAEDKGGHREDIVPRHRSYEP